MTARRIFSALALVALLATGFVAGRASADQPRMHAALEHLRAAKVELEAASDDKGGHRRKALALTKDAIDQVERGIAFDRRH
ncbi:MAG TPA: hypothetical protein VJZ76_14465 [Thermoanaerobaculia bacterium]|nr:hypothetical protein [Thermoanaerobaculia bacterium]